MKPLNYCRHLHSQYTALQNKPMPDRAVELMARAKEVVNRSVKFILPPNGTLLEDNQLKALGDDRLNLPYPVIALEFASEQSVHIEGSSQESSKHIIFAVDVPGEDWILILVCDYLNADDLWATAGYFGIPIMNYVDRTKGGGGLPLVAMADLSGQLDQSPTEIHATYVDDVWRLLSFLNALACSNVRSAALPGPKPIPGRQTKKKPRAGDVYHVLVVDVAASAKSDGCMTSGDVAGDRHSPREHLRRGHIRRLQNGGRIWLNAAVINGKQGFGKVDKDYQLRPVKN